MESPSALHHLSLYFYYNILLFILAAWGLSCSMGGLCCSTWALKCGFSCSVACGIFSQARIEPTSLALGGRFLTPGPPGKSLLAFLLLCERELNFHLMEVIDLLASFIYRRKQFLTTFTLVIRMKTEKACFHLLKAEGMTNIQNDRNETW